MQKALPLVPSLQSNWLMMHVSMMMISYATLIIGSLFSILYLAFYKFVSMDSKITLQSSTTNVFDSSINTTTNSMSSSTIFCSPLSLENFFNIICSKLPTKCLIINIIFLQKNKSF
jgi:hypothetical protein